MRCGMSERGLSEFGVIAEFGVSFVAEAAENHGVKDSRKSKDEKRA